MSKHKLIVFTNPVEGREDEYNAWYDDIHLGEVCEVPGFVSAKRFRFLDDEDGAPEYRYLAIYEMEGDPKEAMKELRVASSSGKMFMSDALGDRKAIVCESLDR